LDHVAVAVHDIAKAAPIFVDAIGGRFLFAADSDEQGFRFAQFALPQGGKIELVAPLSPDGFVAKFLERRGEGVHHVTLKTDDIHAALAALDASGVPVMMVSTSREEWKEAFIHPRDAHGVLIQVAQSSWTDEEMARHHLADHGDAGHRHLAFAELGFSR
jgi:methylmalonyl-CoA epimerase